MLYADYNISFYKQEELDGSLGLLRRFLGSGLIKYKST